MEECGGCKDLCLNVCKAGTEEYMKNDLKLPVRLLESCCGRQTEVALLQPMCFNIFHPRNDAQPEGP